MWNEEVFTLCMAQLNGKIMDYAPCIGCNVVQAMYRRENDLDSDRESILRRMAERK